jgi:hypothetical protein
MSGVMAFVLMFLLGFIGQAVVQNDFNKLGAAPAAAAPSPAPAASTPKPAAATAASSQTTPKPPTKPLVQ